MNLRILAGSVLAVCFAIGLGLMATHGPDPGKPTSPLAAAPTAPPTTWPDYSVNGPGFVKPAMADGDLVAEGYELVSRTFALIGPEVSDSAKRYAGNNLSCQNCHLDSGTRRAGIPLPTPGDGRETFGFFRRSG